MQSTLERSTAAPRHRFDVDAYYRMAETGILGLDDRVELIEGEVVDMAPIASAHAGTTDVLTGLVARAVADGLVVLRVQGPLRLDAHNEPQPDLMLLRPPADRYRRSHPAPADVLLLVEVAAGRSPTTAARSWRSTPATACRRSGWSTSRAEPSKSSASPTAKATSSAIV